MSELPPHPKTTDLTAKVEADLQQFSLFDIDRLIVENQAVIDYLSAKLEKAKENREYLAFLKNEKKISENK